MMVHGKAPTDPATERGDFVAGPQTLAGALYKELHRASHGQRFRAGGSDTLQTTALIHEAYLKLADHSGWESEGHFLAVASRAMRHVLIDAARERAALRRGGGVRPEPLDSVAEPVDESGADEELVRLGDTLDALADFDPELARLVECRYFGGMTDVEVGAALGISERTVRRRWHQARAWIHREMATG